MCKAVLVEQSVRIELPGAPRDLLGIIDLADTLGRVTDFKTSKKSKQQAEADSSVQLTIYASGYHALRGGPPAEVRLDTIVLTSRRIDRQLLVSDRGPADFQALAHRINAVHASIEAGNFPPTTPGSWFCSPKYCGYFLNGCPYINSERMLKAGGHE